MKTTDTRLIEGDWWSLCGDGEKLAEALGSWVDQISEDQEHSFNGEFGVLFDYELPEMIWATWIVLQPYRDEIVELLIALDTLDQDEKLGAGILAGMFVSRDVAAIELSPYFSLDSAGTPLAIEVASKGMVPTFESSVLSLAEWLRRFRLYGESQVCDPYLGCMFASWSSTLDVLLSHADQGQVSEIKRLLTELETFDSRSFLGYSDCL
jgi:hypothetical protein